MSVLGDTFSDPIREIVLAVAPFLGVGLLLALGAGLIFKKARRGSYTAIVAKGVALLILPIALALGLLVGGFQVLSGGRV